MKCREFQNMLPEYLEGSLDKGQRAEAELHLASCTRCREERDQLAILFQPERKTQLRWQQPDDLYWASIVPRLRERIDRPKRTLFPVWATRFVLPAAAAIALVAVLMQLPLRTVSRDQSATRSLAQVPIEELQLFTEQQAVIGLNDVVSPAPDRASSDDKAVLKEILHSEKQGYTLPSFSASETMQESAFDNLNDQDAEQVIAIIERDATPSTN